MPANKVIVVGGVVARVPPHADVVPTGTVRPAGSVSVKPTPVRLNCGFGLVIVKVSATTPLRGMPGSAKALLMEGGATIARLAVAVAPLPPSFELTLPVKLVTDPAVVAVTLTAKEQVAAGAMEAPLRLTTLPPAAAVMRPPSQPPAKPLGVETTKPAGSVSLTPTPVNVVAALGLLIVKVRVVDPLSGTDAEPKALLMVGGATTVSDALETLPVPPSFEVTWTALFFWPAAVPVTLTVMVQLPDGARVAPVRLTKEDPATAVTAPPPHPPVSPLALATTSPAGRLSVKSTPVSERVLLGLATVKLRVVLPPTGIDTAPNDFTIVGGLATVSVAEAALPVPPLAEVTLPVVLR